MTRENLFKAHMPEIDMRADIEVIFFKARAAAEKSVQGADGFFRQQVIIITPGRLLVSKECPIPSEVSTSDLQKLAQLIPPQPARSIAVIAYTLLDALKEDLLKAIPFFDYLLGFSMLGHKVWVFEGHQHALAAGCRDADMLLVDAAMLPELEKSGDWQSGALSVMRGKEIRVIAR